MSWALLSIGAAVAYALHGVWSARVSRALGPLVAGWGLFTFALPLLGLVLLSRGIPPIGAGFWSAWAANTLLNFGASYLFLSALRMGELGITYPLLALTPLFVIPIEWVLLGELPGPWGVVGVCLIVTGVYLLNFGARSAGFLAPIVALARSPGALRMLVVAVLWSLAGTLDRVAVLHASAPFYAFMLTAGLAILYLPVLVVARLRASPGGEADGSPGGGVADGLGSRVPLLAVHGFLFAVMFALQMEALTGALASYVLSIKRSGAVLAVLLGIVFLREPRVATRLLGTFVTVVGGAVLVLLG